MEGKEKVNTEIKVTKEKNAEIMWQFSMIFDKLIEIDKLIFLYTGKLEKSI